MRRAGLERVRAVPVAGRPSLVNLEGSLPGVSGQEIVLSAHYDTVAGSPGAGDDASGCGVVLAAAADLARTPRRHAVRVVLFDGEEKGLLGSQAWVKGLAPEARSRVLANLNVEMVGWPGSAGPVLHTFPVREKGRRVMPPGWLVHAVLRGGEAAGLPLSVADNRYPVLGQYVLRSARVRLAADSDSFLKMGIPAVALSDSSALKLDPAYHGPEDTAARLDAKRLERWTDLVAASVRRLDALAGRPLPEDRYLAAFGRVWLRRDLMWPVFLVWALLVFRGRPGRWRGASAEEHRRQGRAYVPGFLFRMLLLLAILLAPVFAVLLFPAALLALAPPRRVWARALAIALGVLPALLVTAAVVSAIAIGAASRKAGFEGSWLDAGLVAGTLVCYALLIGRGSTTRSQRP
jgi:hypothetical protein